MIDPATGWFEMREIKTKSAGSVANVLEQAWLTHYPWPTRMIFDRGSEFKAELCQMIKKRLWRKGEAYYDTKSASECYRGKSTQNDW